MKVNGHISHRKIGYVLNKKIISHAQTAGGICGYDIGSYYDLDNSGVQFHYISDLLDLSFSYTRQKRNENPKKKRWGSMM